MNRWKYSLHDDEYPYHMTIRDIEINLNEKLDVIRKVIEICETNRKDLWDYVSNDLIFSICFKQVEHAVIFKLCFDTDK